MRQMQIIKVRALNAPWHEEALSASGEVLGCTAPTVVGSADAIVFVADGRFHLEAIMIANPSIPAFR